MILQSFFRIFPFLFCLCFSTPPALGALALLDTHPVPSTPPYATLSPAGLTGLALDRRDPGRGFMSGVMGGMASETLSEALYDVVPASNVSERVERTSSLAQLGTGVLALLADQNVGVAVDVAQNALTHNFIPSMLSGGDGALMAEAESLQEMLEDESLDATLLKLGFIPAMNAEGALGYQLGETFYATAESAFLSYLTHNPMLNVALTRFLERPDMAEKITQGRWLEYLRPTSKAMGEVMRIFHYGRMMGAGFGLGSLGGPIGEVIGLYGGYQAAVLTEYVVEEMTQGAIHFLADTAEAMFPGSGAQTVYETVDVADVLIPYTQVGRGLMKLHPGKMGGRTSRWLPQRMATSWDRLVPTPLHTWTDAFFPQLQPQLALASGGFSGGSFSGLMPPSTRGTTFKMDGGLPSSKGKVDAPSKGTHGTVTPGGDPGSIKILPRAPKICKTDGTPNPTPQIKKITNDSPKNVVNSVKLKAKLAFQEAGILDQQGRLTSKAIRESKAILEGEKIRNHQVRKILTQEPHMNIKDWAKFETLSAKMPNGQSRKIHFYMNRKTGKVDYKTVDYKIKDPVTDTKHYKKSIKDLVFMESLLKNQ